MPPARPIRVLGVDQRQGDEGAAVPRPALQLGQVADGGFVSQDRPLADALRQCVPDRAAGRRGSARGSSRSSRVDLQLDQVADGSERVAEQEAGPLQRAEQVADHRKGTALDPRKIQGRPARLVHFAVNQGHLQAGIDLDIDPPQLPGSLQVGDTVPQAAIAHADILLQRPGVSEPRPPGTEANRSLAVAARTTPLGF